MITFDLLDGFEEDYSHMAGYTGGYRHRYPIHCSECGRFAKVVRSGNSYYGDDPWWEVECKKDGLVEGMIGEF